MKAMINKKFICLALLACLPAQAEIYKCVNKQGKTVYNDKPCPVYDKETKLKAVKDPKNGYVPPVFVKSKEGEGKSTIVGFDAANKVSTPVKEKDRPKDEHSTSLTNGANGESNASNNVVSSSSYERPPSPYFAKADKASKGKEGEAPITLPRVELKVENRAY